MRREGAHSEAAAGGVTTAIIRDAAVESWEDHVEAWHHAGRIVDGQAWERARIAASLKGRYGEDAIGKFAREVRFSRSAVYFYARTFAAFPEKSNRLDNLKFTHHLHAAALTETPAQAREMLALAESEGWSANALRAYLRPPKELTEGEAEDFHILVESTDFKDALASIVRERAKRWPDAHRAHIAEVLRSLADDLEEEFSVR
jgi:hypothetical protein